MARTGPVGIGLVGAGVISDTYLENLTGFPDTEVLAVGDLYPDAARSRAAAHGVEIAGDVSVVLDHPDVEIVVNLTVPVAHAEVAEAAVAAGKHVWNEKPLTLDRESGQRLLAAAEAAGVFVTGAPDTFLGEGLQTTRRLLEAGTIGTPLSALVLFQSAGPDAWHPNPAFFFLPGAGPLFDMGPYYLTTLVQLFGPVATVAATGSRARNRRVVGSGPKAGEEFDVAVPSQVSALISFASGQSAQAMFSFDSAVRRTLLEVNGTDGALLVPDPNTFAGEVQTRTQDSEDWETVATTTEKSSRGTGVLELARSIRAGRRPRTDAALAYHVLDTMLAIAESVETGAFVPVASTVEVPALLPEDWDPHQRTL